MTKRAVQQPLSLEWRKRGLETVPQQPGPAVTSKTQYWIAQLSQGIVEVAAGLRPPNHLHTVVSPRVLSRLRVMHAVAGSRANAPVRRTSSVRVTQVSPNVLEACAVVHGRRRPQAVALQLRRRRDRWIVTAAEV